MRNSKNSSPLRRAVVRLICNGWDLGMVCRIAAASLRSLARTHGEPRIAVLAYETMHVPVVDAIVRSAVASGCPVDVYTVAHVRDQLQSVERRPELESWIQVPLVPRFNVRRHERIARLRRQVSRWVVGRRAYSLFVVPNADYYIEDYAPVIDRAPDRTMLMVHNLNRVFRNPETRGRFEAAMSAVESLAVLDGLLRDEIVGNGLFAGPVHEIPLVYRGRAGATASDRVEFVVLGAVIDERRDYGDLVAALERVPEDLIRSVSVTLLGSAASEYGRTVQERLRTVERERGLRLHTYDGFVSQAEFERVMARADVIVGLVVQQFRVPGWDETYNVTKISGTVHDVVAYGLPVIVPSYLPMPDRLEPCVLRFADVDELVGLIASLTDGDVIADLQRRAIECAGRYHALDLRSVVAARAAC